MSSRSQLDAGIHAFGAELRSFVQRASDSITALKRTAEQRPQAGVQDFKECLEDLEQQVADYTDEIQQLAQYTADSISFEELIGHCSAVYSINRTTALALEQHLAQYGYQQPAGAVLEPETLHDNYLLQDDNQVSDGEEFTIGFTGRPRQANSLPASPVSKSSTGLLRASAAGGYVPSRLGRSQPGSPIAATAAAAASGLPGDTMLPRDAAPLSVIRGLAGVGAGGSSYALAGAAAGTAVPQTQLRQQQQQQQQQQPNSSNNTNRVSLGSNTSSTPSGLMISPGVAALASKYATSSAGGSSIGFGMPEQQSTGGPDSRPRRSPCRDLNLSYALASANSPDLPIFGRSAATPQAAATTTAGLQQHQALETPLAGQYEGGGGGDGGAAAADDDSTGELYSSLIHSNLGGRRGAVDSTPDAEVTPPCTRGGVSPGCGSPQAPATAGRLPPTWVIEKMQQLEDLQADVTLTLSQMKRCPSRSRTAPTDEGGSSDSDSDDLGQADFGGDAKEEEEEQEHRRLGPFRNDMELCHGHRQQPQQQLPQVELQQRNHTQRGADAPVAVSPPAAHLQQPAPLTQHEPAASIAATPAARAAAAEHQQHRQAGATAGAAAAAPTDSLTAAAAAASADLENLMASLSMKYALNSDEGSRRQHPSSSSSIGQQGQEQPASPAVAALELAGCTGVEDPVGFGCSSSSSSTLAAGGYQQTPRRVGAVASSLKKSHPAATATTGAEVYRLQDIPGFSPQPASTVQQQQQQLVDVRLAAAEPAVCADTTAAAPAAMTGPLTEADITTSIEDASSGAGGSGSGSSLLLSEPVSASEREAGRAVLRPMQVQDCTAASPADVAATTASAAVGLRQSRQRQQQQQQVDKPAKLTSCPDFSTEARQQRQQQQGEALTPRAARLQRRLQMMQQQQPPQQEHQQEQDVENAFSRQQAKAASSAAGDGGQGVADAGSGVGEVQAVTAEEFSQLPGWCRSLLSVELLNGVLQELSELSVGRCQAGSQESGGFTAEDVAMLGHSSSKSKTIVSCLHKLSRATLQRSVTGGNVYKLASAGGNSS